MNKAKFIKENPLEFSLPLKESNTLEKILKQAQRDHGIVFEKTPDIKVGKLQYYHFNIYGYTTNFAQAYFHIGLLYAERVLPIWNKRHKKLIKK